MGLLKWLAGILLVATDQVAPVISTKSSRAIAAQNREGIQCRDNNQVLIFNLIFFLALFTNVIFKNEECQSADGNMGVCYTASECSRKGGIGSGSCASNYGVCCVCK